MRTRRRRSLNHFLHEDLESGVTAGDIRFSVMALLDRPGDPIMDVTLDGRTRTVVTGAAGNDRHHRHRANEAATQSSSIGSILRKASDIRQTKSLRHATPPTRSHSRNAGGAESGRRVPPTTPGGPHPFPPPSPPFCRGFAAPNPRTNANRGRKHSREVALIGKPGRYRNLRQRQISHGHQLLRRLDSLLKQPLVRRQAGRDSKRARNG